MSTYHSSNYIHDTTPFASLSQQLELFSKDLILSSDDLQKCSEKTKNVEDVLRQNLLHYSIARVVCAGSVGKGTALRSRYDIDIIVFFHVPESDNFENFRRRVILDIKKAIDKSYSTYAEVKGNTSLSFYNSNRKIDILPAKNAVENRLCHLNVAQEQYDAIIRDINDKRDAFIYMISMNELSVEHIRKQSEFVRYLIVLGKYWLFNRVNIHFKGRSSIVELVALHAGKEIEKKSSDRTLYHGFVLFLKLWINVSSMKIAFYDYYSSDDIRLQMHSSPFLIDSVNPYNNRLSSLSSYDRSTLASIAQESYNDLEKLKGDPCSSKEDAGQSLSQIVSALFRDYSMRSNPQIYSQQISEFNSYRPPPRDVVLDITTYEERENEPSQNDYSKSYQRKGWLHDYCTLL